MALRPGSALVGVSYAPATALSLSSSSSSSAILSSSESSSRLRFLAGDLDDADAPLLLGGTECGAGVDSPGSFLTITPVVVSGVLGVLARAGAGVLPPPPPWFFLRVMTCSVTALTVGAGPKLAAGMCQLFVVDYQKTWNEMMYSRQLLRTFSHVDLFILLSGSATSCRSRNWSLVASQVTGCACQK